MPGPGRLLILRPARWAVPVTSSPRAAVAASPGPGRAARACARPRSLPPVPRTPCRQRCYPVPRRPATCPSSLAKSGGFASHTLTVDDGRRSQFGNTRRSFPEQQLCRRCCAGGTHASRTQGGPVQWARPPTTLQIRPKQTHTGMESGGRCEAGDSLCREQSPRSVPSMAGWSRPVLTPLGRELPHALCITTLTRAD